MKAYHNSTAYREWLKAKEKGELIKKIRMLAIVVFKFLNYCSISKEFNHKILDLNKKNDKKSTA